MFKYKSLIRLGIYSKSHLVLENFDLLLFIICGIELGLLFDQFAGLGDRPHKSYFVETH